MQSLSSVERRTSVIRHPPVVADVCTPGNHNRRHLPHGQGLQCYKVAGLRIGPTVEIISVRD